MSERTSLVPDTKRDTNDALLGEMLNGSGNAHGDLIRERQRLNADLDKARTQFSQLAAYTRAVATTKEHASYKVIAPIFSIYTSLIRLDLYNEFVSRSASRVHGNAKYRSAPIVQALTQSPDGWQLDSSNRSLWAACLDFGLDQGWKPEEIVQRIKGMGGIAACAKTARAAGVKPRGSVRSASLSELDAFITGERTQILAALGLPRDTPGDITVVSVVEVRIGPENRHTVASKNVKAQNALKTLREIVNRPTETSPRIS